jgi:hypothetical protein
MRLVLAAVLVVGVAVSAACSGGGGGGGSGGQSSASASSGGVGGAGPCTDFFGDPDQPVEIEPALLVPGAKIIALHDGDAADLIRPQQGGHCLFVAARVKNICKDHASLSAKVLDPEGALVSGPDGKSPVVWVETGGWLEPEADNGADMPNVCACPARIEPVEDHDMIVEVTVTDDVSRRAATAKVRVVPACRQTVAECKTLCDCECGPNGAGFCQRPTDLACETNP